MKKNAPKHVTMQNSFSDMSLFKSLDIHNSGSISSSSLINGLNRAGIRPDDPRISSLIHQLDQLNSTSDHLNAQTFKETTQDCSALIEKALQGLLVVPNFIDFANDIQSIYDTVKSNPEGKVASYIPQLAKVAPDKFGISVCTIDGQRFSLGDSNDYFSIQSVSKPINYCLALEAFGEDTVHKHVGREPSGSGFNAITLDSQNRPHNPMINAGAIMSCSMIKPHASPAERFDYVLSFWQKLSEPARLKPIFNNTVYLSEKRTADRNFALAYFMREKKKFPENTNLMETLDLYFQCCSIELTCDAMAIVAATLAKGGINPFTGERLLSPGTVKNCLSLMYSCGMYDFSGEFAFTIGLPAKSGVGGGLMLVIPNVMGICIWAPPLDSTGNSVKGLHFCRELVEKFNFHNYDSLIQGNSGKKDPRVRHADVKLNTIGALCWAASQGDIAEIQQMIARGIDINEPDYDGRTPLHIAASEGHYSVAELFIRNGAQVHVKDRWGNTPLDDAIRSHHTDIEKLIQDYASSNPVKNK